MDVTRERISRILELREILLSIQTGFSLVNAVVVCAILEGISGLGPSSVKIEPRYLKLVTVSSFCPFTLISVLMPLVLFVISLVFSALISMRRPWRLCRGAQLNLPALLPLVLSNQCHQQSLDKASTAYGMEISAEKTKLMTNNTSGINTEIKVKGSKDHK